MIFYKSLYHSLLHQQKTYNCLTFGEEAANSKAEADCTDCIQQKKHQCYCGTGISCHWSPAGWYTKEQQHDQHCYQHEQQVLEEPGRPV